MMRRAAAVLCAVVGAAGFLRSADGLVVFAASSFTNVLEAIDAEYTRATRQLVLLNVGASNSLARQIIEGAPADIFCSADEPQMDRVERAGRIAGRRAAFAFNQLVIVVSRDRSGPPIRSAADLLNAAVGRVAVGDPTAVPVGVYTRQYLERLGLWTRLAPKIVPTANVRAALAAVDSGNADAAFVYATDAPLAAHAAVAFRVPRDEAPVAHWCARVASGGHAADADRYLQFLTAEPARALIRRFGFIQPS